MERIAEQVSRVSSFVVGVRDVGRVLAAIQASSELWEIVSLSDRPFNVVVEITRLLHAEGLISFVDGRVVLTPAGQELCREREVVPRMMHRCPTCGGSGVSVMAFEKALARFKELAANRPSPKVDLDQAYVTPETTMARIAVMADRGDLARRDLIILGDDDLMGLAAALTGLPRRVVVLELDADLIYFIGQTAKEEGLAVETSIQDLRDPLPDHYLGAFDTFFTDPPDTLGGLELFVARALSAVRSPGSAGYFGVTNIESSLYKWRKWQRRLLDKYGLVITDIVRDLSTYANWPYLVDRIGFDLEPLRHPPEKPWYKSSLYRVELLSDSVREPDEGMDKRLYIDQESLLWSQRSFPSEDQRPSEGKDQRNVEST